MGTTKLKTIKNNKILIQEKIYLLIAYDLLTIVLDKILNARYIFGLLINFQFVELFVHSIVPLTIAIIHSILL